jgi:hypothetical protein
VNVAMLALLATGTRVAIGMKNFRLQTGLSTDELQQWNHEAEVNDVTAQELTATIEGLQDARASFALGEPKDVGAWALLGVDPREDPFEVLDKLRTKLRDVQDVGVARNLAARVGISANVFQMLRSANDEFSKWRKQFEVTKQQEDRLIRLNRAWKDLRYSLQAVQVQFAAALAPAIEVLVKVLSWATKKVAEFNAWLNSSAMVGKVFRFIIGGLAVAFLLLGAAAAVITAALAALSAVMVLLSPAIAALLPLLAEAAVFLGLLLAVIVAVVLAVDDMWEAFSGGKSVLRDVGERIGEWLAKFETIREIVLLIDEVFTKLMKFGSGKFETVFRGVLERDDKSWEAYNAERHGPGWFAPRSPMTSAPSVNQNVKVDVAIDGAQSPEATGKAVGRSIREELDAAAYQMPVPNL